MRNLAIIILLAIMMTGCVSPRKTFKGPDPSALVATSQELNSRVLRANVVAARARLTRAEVQGATKRVEAAVAAVKPKLAELFRVSPPELLPLIIEIQKDLAAAEKENLYATERIAALEKLDAELREELQLANVAKDKHTREVASYIAEADLLAAVATKERDARNKAETSLNWYRFKFWGAWVALGAAVLVGLILWIAKIGMKFRPP